MSQILLIGKPNSGKTLLFNRLTHSNNRAANFPGATVEIKRGVWNTYSLTDFPGTYSLTPLTSDEELAITQFKKAVDGSEAQVVICVLDATRLEVSLNFALRVMAYLSEKSAALVFAVNMMDDLESNGLTMDLQGLSASLGVPMVGVSARLQKGFPELLATVEKAMSDKTPIRSYNETDIAGTAQRLTRSFGPKGDVLIKRMNRLDQIFLSSFWGGVLFLIIMLLVFQSVFAWSVPMMDAVEGVIGFLGEQVSGLLPDGVIKDFINDAIFGGLGAFLVFVPQIFVLTFIIGLLEDSGYLARVAIICHRPLQFFGLSGKSFIPYLSGHACAIPAIYATRIIESPRRRWITLITLPLIACSARLPVYALFITALIPAVFIFGGLISLQGLTFFFLFILGYIVALLVSALSARFLFKNKSDAPFIIELPQYRWPVLSPLLLRSLRTVWRFSRDAGPVIFMVSVVVWFFSYFPNGSGHLDSSWLAQLGHWIEPLVAPLGLDWKYAVAILASFLAREVFVGTLGTFYGIEKAEDSVSSLSESIKQDGVTLASGMALLVFYVVALQCVSTLATLRRETGSWKMPALLFIGYTVLAYILALITYQILN